MTEARTTPDSNDNPTMTHTSKKKRIDDQALPADIGLKPVQLQRRRVWRACESCRRKKIKCDGMEPTCSQCATSKSQCTWLQTKDRAALSRHYVQELEARLLHMESLFHQVAPILEQVGQATGLDLTNLTSPASAGAPGSVPNVLQSVLPKIKEAAGQDNGSVPYMNGAAPIKVEDDISDSFGQLALDEHGHMHWIGGSSTMSLIQSFRAMTSSPLHRVSPMEEDPLAPGPSVNKLYFPASVFFGKVRALPSPEEVEYPDRDLADKMVDAYFARFHFLMPIIDKPSFMRQYTFLMDHRNDSTLAKKQTAFIALVCAVFAVAARLVDDPRLSKADNLDDAGMGMVYYERALILHYISHVSMQVEHVQCFLLMSSFLCSVNCLPQAWLLVGQAVRSAQDIGLHRSPRRLLISPIEKETRRKIWWGVYTLDRMLALALGRPLAIEDADCDVELPVEIDDENLPEYFSGAAISRDSPSLMRGYVELISLYKIAGQVLRQVYALDKCKDNLELEKRTELQRAVDSLDKSLTKWCDDLPSIFKSNPITEKQVTMAAVLCSHYYSILTTLHRNFLPVRRDQPIAPRSTAKAVSTARASAVIILLYAMHATDPAASHAAMDEARSCLTVLETWEGHWPGARKCKELLEDLTATASEAIRAAAGGHVRVSSNASSSASTASVLSDGRMSAPISVSVSERLIKSRPRRNRSRDVRLSPRQAQAMQFRPDSLRARSTSRKRPHDEDLFSDPYAIGLPSSYPGRSNLSAHSSPVSVNSHPSPPGQSLDAQEPSPQLASSSSYGPLNIPQSPAAPVPHAHFDYDYGLSQSPSERWNGTGGDANGLKFFPSGSQQQSATTFNNNTFTSQLPTLDTSYLGYDGTDLGFGGLSSTPPSAGFAGPGLPFRGLDYIRNYNPGGGGYPVGGDQDQCWQTFDSGAFGYDPDIPFTLGDFSGDGQHWHDGQ
ncbi:Transcriptional activator protein acu-15 [Grifola frondosa]|uniref:Transcriptional activator protein acu-15 n=1 Tax=Grifola frondosa TaxID=5627 RepID=A0A1C7MIS1_GRIFR|nr:Transcriptional activator protein acu-15 [Grifola frondosa]